jgi:hypothetical protein
MTSRQRHPIRGLGPSSGATRPPHPATLVQKKAVIGAAAARPPHPATVIQPRLPAGPAPRPPHPALISSTAQRSQVQIVAVEKASFDTEYGITSGVAPRLYDLCPATRPGQGNVHAITAGLYCETSKRVGDWFDVYVWSGLRRQGWLHKDDYLKQIDLVDRDKDRLHWVELWNPNLFELAPGLTDVRQGNLDDCFLLASLAALAGTAMGQATIKGMITPLPQERSYSVRFYAMDRDEQFTIATDVVVDAWLPVTAAGDFAYCPKGYRALPQSQGLWSAIIEKAFAQFLGDDGYHGLDQKGDPDDALGQLTGTRFENVTDMNDDGDEDLLGYIRGFGARPKVADTVDVLPMKLRAKLTAEHVYVLVRLEGEDLLLWDQAAYKKVQITLDELRAGFTSIGSPYDDSD